MNLFVQIVEAKDLPSMDMNGKSDPYCKAYLSGQEKHKQSTKVIEKTLNPIWNELLVFDLSGTSKNSCLCIDMKDKDLITSERISSIKIQLNSITPNKVAELWLSMTPYKGVKKGGNLHVILHVAPKGSKPFVEIPEVPPPSQPITEDSPNPQQSNTEEASSPNTSEPQQNDSPEITQTIETTEPTDQPQENTQDLDKSNDKLSTEAIQPETSTTPSFQAEPPPAVEQKPEFDFSKYNIYIICFTPDDISNSTARMLCDSISHKLTDKGCNTLFVPICSSLTDCKEILNVLQKDDKALMLQIGSTETTKRIKVVAEAFNETNFVVPDVQDNSPIGEKIFDDMELGQVIPNEIDLESIIASTSCPFKLYHDQDRYLFNYLYALGLRSVGNVVGGCVFIQVPSFDDIPINLQISFVFELIEKLLQLPQFN